MRETTCEDFETFKLFLVFIYQTAVMFSNVKVFSVRRVFGSKRLRPAALLIRGALPR